MLAKQRYTKILELLDKDGIVHTAELVKLMGVSSETIRKDLESGHYWSDYNVDGWQRTFSPYELSFLFFETYDGIRGRGLLDLARETVAMDTMAQRFGKKFYQNGARLSGVLEVDTDAKPETRRRLKDEFRGYAADDAFAVAVLDHGMKFTPLGISQSDAQYIESRQFTA